MAKPNDQFREARERIASPTCPDDSLSRQELAELVNAWIWEHHHTMMETSAGYIGQLERGTIQWPGRLYREAFRAILGVSTDAALGFVNSRRAVVKLKDVDRKKFIQTATGLGVGALLLEGPVAALLEISEPTPIPNRVSATDIEQIRTASRVFSGWDFTYGGGLARDAVMGQLRWAEGLLRAKCPDRLRPELFCAVGDLARRAGFMTFDAGADEDARGVFRFALACAEKAGDWDLRAYVLDGMALQAILTGRPDEGLTLTEQALVRADRLTETLQAILHTDRGRALARMRRVNEALSAVGAAEDHFAHCTRANDPPFVDYWNAAFLAGNTGQVLFDLAVLGHHPAQAIDQLTVAADAHTARPRTVCLTKLASLTMATGDPIQAATIGHVALDAAGAVRSRLVVDYLRELARYATPHQRLDEVAHLRHRIARLVPPASQ